MNIENHEWKRRFENEFLANENFDSELFKFTCWSPHSTRPTLRNLLFQVTADLTK